MRKLAFLGLMLVSLVSFTQVAGAATTSGSKSIMFGFDNFMLGGYSDVEQSFPLLGFGKTVGIGMRYFMSDGTALRPALGFTYGKETQTQEKPTTTATDDETTTMGVSFSLALEKHMKAGEKVSPYMGVGAGIMMLTDKNEPSNVPPLSAGDTTEDKTTTTNFAGFGLLGFDWSFTDNLSIGGEYRLGVTVGSEKQEVTDFDPTQSTEDKTTTTNIGVSSGTLYLTFGW